MGKRGTGVCPARVTRLVPPTEDWTEVLNVMLCVQWREAFDMRTMKIGVCVCVCVCVVCVCVLLNSTILILFIT